MCYWFQITCQRQRAPAPAARMRYTSTYIRTQLLANYYNTTTHATFHEAIYNYKATGTHYYTCLHHVVMEYCGHAEIVYAFQWIEKKVMKGSIKE